jgi:Kdo2-lipid IVA lauroyltransferase/acyltransferase
LELGLNRKALFNSLIDLQEMYTIVYGIFYLISLLPWRVMYIISDFITFILFHVIGYRKKVVIANLLIAFPEKSERERSDIVKLFYRQFTDNFIEVIKFLSISKKELNRRFVCDYSVINDLYSSGKNIQLLLGHFFNWEFANLAYANNLLYPFVVVYKPIESKIFSRLFNHVRKRFGTHLVAADTFRKDFSQLSKQRFCLVLVGDQNPGDPNNAYWTPFFGKMTPFVKGPERGAKLYDAAVVMCNFYTVKRGYYRSEIKLLTTEPRSMPDGAITRHMISFVEESLRDHNANYLWSHKRWKHAFRDKHQHLVIGDK